MKTATRLLTAIAALGLSLTATAQPLVLGRVHTNMLPVVQAPDMPTARGHLGIPTVASTNRVIVNTITDVAAYQRTNSLPNVIETLGFAAAGDRGAAAYVWRNTSNPTNIYRINAVGGGQWWEYDYLNGNICNILKAGATPFDTTDDSVAIQRAFDAAAQQSAGGSLSNLGDEPTVYFPPGRYYMANPVSYKAPSRSHANISITGDGIYNTTLVATSSGFPAGGNKPVIYLENVRLNMSGFSISSEWGGIQPDYRATGIHTRDCDYGFVREVRISKMSRGIVLDNGSMNWNRLTGLQFESNYIDVFAAGAQGLNADWHSTTSAHTWFGPANGLNLDIQCEGSGNYSEFIPAGIYLPAANNAYVRWGYNESSGSTLYLGIPLTNRVTLSTQNGTTITAAFTNAHYYVNGYAFTIIAEQSVPSDIQNYIVGNRTVVSASRTNNVLTFNAGGTVTSPLSGYTFLAVLDSVNHGVMNSRFWAKGVGGKPVYMDKVRNIELFGGNLGPVYTTERSRAVEIRTVRDVTDDTFYYHETLDTGTKKHLPPNVFPDPTLQSGMSWASGSSFFGNASAVVTNCNGQPAMLLYVASKPASSYAQWRFNWVPNVPMSWLNGRKLTVGMQVRELNHPAWRPNGFTINSGGSGYTGGTATVTHGGRTVEVNLTTSGGAITAATWRFGAFITNDATVANLAVTQGSASEGVITPTGFTDYSALARLSSRDFKLVPAYWNESIPGTLYVNGVAGIGVTPAFQSYRDGTLIGGSYGGHYGPVDGSKSGFRFIFMDTSLDANNAVGTEAYVVTLLAALVDAPLDNLELLQNDWYHQPFLYLSRYRSGIGGTLAGESGVASLFAGNDSGGRTGLRLINSLGTSGFVPYYLGEFASDPSSGMSAGAFYRNTSNNNFRFYTGTTWVDF